MVRQIVDLEKLAEAQAAADDDLVQFFSYRGKARVELAGLAFAREGYGEFQIHLRAVRRLVVGKTRIAVDAREIRAAAAATIEAWIEAQNLRSKLFAQRAQRLDHGLLVAVAIRCHPFGAIVARQIAKESEGLARDR